MKKRKINPSNRVKTTGIGVADHQLLLDFKKVNIRVHERMTSDSGRNQSQVRFEKSEPERMGSNF